MKKTGMLWAGVALVVVGLVGLIGVSAMRSFRQPATSPGPMMSRDVDAMFIEQMIPHHEDAIAMAELALTRAEHREIRQLAENIIETQSAEVDQMREWYREWYESDVPDVDRPSGWMGGMGGMGGGMMGGDIDLENLEEAEQFDKAFIEAMVPHHHMAIMMAQMLDNQTSRPEMHDLAESIIETQSDEIRTMQEWYDEWY